LERFILSDFVSLTLRQKWQRPRSTAGFTVPELLAVVAVISIIMSILLPSFGEARERARLMICRSNLHQIAIGSRSYATETRYMPNGYEAGTQWIVWVPEIFEHAPDPKLFYCPTAPAVAKWAGVRFGSGLPAQYGYKLDQVRIHASENFSYGHNNGGSSDNNNPSLGVGDHVGAGWNRITMVKAGSNFIMYGDSTVDGLWDHFIDEDIMDGTGRSEFPADRHNGGAHIAFGDGHVEHILQKYLIYLGSEGTALPEMRRRWNNDNEPH